MTKPQLVELITRFAQKHSQIQQELIFQIREANGDSESLVNIVRQNIHDYFMDANQDDRDNQNWDDDGHESNLDRIKCCLLDLLAKGHADDTLELGREFLIRAIHQHETSHGRNSLEWDIPEIIQLLRNALDQSEKPPLEKLEWIMDLVQNDSTDFTAGLNEYLLRSHPENIARQFLEKLEERLKSYKPQSSDPDFQYLSRRGALVDLVSHYMKTLDLKDRIIDLCVIEAEKHQGYERLIRHLLDLKDYEKAIEWINRAIEEDCSGSPYSLNKLKDLFTMILRRKRQWPQMAAFRVQEFCYIPNTLTFDDCQKACQRLENWSEVRPFLMAFLETGQLPWLSQGWPLPYSGLTFKRNPYRRYPEFSLLIDLAIREKRSDDTLHWYDLITKESFYMGDFDDKVAKVLEKSHPMKSIEIWKATAIRLINTKDPGNYDEAGNYLKDIKRLLNQMNLSDKWDAWLEKIRTEHRQKSRLMKVLDQIEKKTATKVVRK